MGTGLSDWLTASQWPHIHFKEFTVKEHWGFKTKVVISLGNKLFCLLSGLCCDLRVGRQG